MDISIIQLLWNPLAGLTDWLSSAFDGLIQSFLSIFTTPIAFLLYSIQMGFFYVLDCVQGIFKSMAGLGTYYKDGQEQSGDMVMSMLMDQTIINIFIAVLVVSIMLLFVTTMIAVIRVEFTEKGAGNAKGPIIGRAVKSIAYFAIVPIVCLFGIWIANVFLRSFDKATSGSSYSLSTTVFYAAAQDGNRARYSTTIATNMAKNDDLLKALGLTTSIRTQIDSGGGQETLARAIDAAFLSRQEVVNSDLGKESMTIDMKGQAYTTCAILLNGIDSDINFSSFDTRNIFLTFYFYDTFMGYNYLIGYVGGFIAASLMLSSAIGLVQRLYELSILFIVSPAAVAFMPIDDGAKYKSWRGEFIKRVGMMYGPVIGLNLMFMILAALRHITIFPDTPSNALFNGLIQLIFLVVGLLSVKEFSGIISSLVGSNDALSVGEGKRKDTVAMAGRMAGGQVAAARMTKEGIKAAGATVGNTKLGRKYHSMREASYNQKAKDLQAEAVRLAATDPNRAKKVGERAMKAHEMAEEHKNIAAGGNYSNTMQGQLNQIWQGEGVKTALGRASGDFFKAAGPTASFFTRSAIAERNKNGQSALAQLPIFASKAKGVYDENGNLIPATKSGAYDKTLGGTFKKLITGKLASEGGDAPDYKGAKDAVEKGEWETIGKNKHNNKSAPIQAKELGLGDKPTGIHDGSVSFQGAPFSGGPIPVTIVGSSGAGGSGAGATGGSSGGGSSSSTTSTGEGYALTPEQQNFSGELDLSMDGGSVTMSPDNVEEEALDPTLQAMALGIEAERAEQDIENADQDVDRETHDGAGKQQVEITNDSMKVELPESTSVGIKPHSLTPLMDRLSEVGSKIEKTTHETTKVLQALTEISTNLENRIFSAIKKGSGNSGSSGKGNSNKQ